MDADRVVLLIFCAFVFRLIVSSGGSWSGLHPLLKLIAGVCLFFTTVISYDRALRNPEGALAPFYGMYGSVAAAFFIFFPWGARLHWRRKKKPPRT